MTTATEKRHHSLHILSQPASEGQALHNCLIAATDDDSLVLLGEGVYNAITPPAGLHCFALRPDVELRQLGNRISASVELIDYPRFVELCTLHQPICSWY